MEQPQSLVWSRIRSDGRWEPILVEWIEQQSPGTSMLQPAMPAVLAWQPVEGDGTGQEETTCGPTAIPSMAMATSQIVQSRRSVRPLMR